MSELLRIERALRLHQLLGPGAAAALQAAGLPCPEAEQSALSHGGGFVARTGAESYFLAVEHDFAPLLAAPAWHFPVSDTVFRLEGAGWGRRLGELCALDLRALAEGGWLMTRLAHLSVWLYRPPATAALLLGCDPSYARYMQTTLEAVAASASDTAKP
ncbi:hypothetical protein [Algiphilus aromaticivorans]|jgi:hypothetical protein|uniref:hypothetical protein n=1 Tax=Algiphilus aromaticivorans TaxID=382454 RepID=UPI0005C1E3AF|nr:hypothetical protein [Algiphilus aromaticivorans]